MTQPIRLVRQGLNTKVRPQKLILISGAILRSAADTILVITKVSSLNIIANAI